MASRKQNCYVKERYRQKHESNFLAEKVEMQNLEEQKDLQEMENINFDLKSTSEAGRIQDELFFIIHINTFCYCLSKDRYYPAEIAVSCFSLEDGVLPQNVFHRIVYPGALPLGYLGEAKSTSDKTHQLPPPLSGDSDNTEEVYLGLKQFLSNKLSGSERFPPLYVEKKMLKLVRHVLDKWCCDFGESKSIFKVYNLQYMFKVLKNIVAKSTIWPTILHSTRVIENDPYAYSGDTCCEYHNVSGVSEYCSKSVVVRYAYVICDNCCPDLGIILVPGLHFPESDMSYNDSRSSSRNSSVFNSSTFKPSVREDDEDSCISLKSGNQSVLSEASNYSYKCKSAFYFSKLCDSSVVNKIPIGALSLEPKELETGFKSNFKETVELSKEANSAVSRSFGNVRGNGKGRRMDN